MWYFEPVILTIEVDSDWAGNIDDMKSTIGYAFSLCSSMFSWNSRKQEIEAQSTSEVEYV
jgi:hypothetical protein